MTEQRTETESSAPEAKRSGRRRAWIEAGAVIAVLLGVRAVQKRSLVEGVAPAVVSVDLDGRPARLGAAAEGPQLLWFFATWCSVCRASEHNVRAMAGEGSVVMIASDSGGDDALRAYLREHGLTGVRVVNDRDGAIARRFGVRAFPTTFALGEGGRIRATEVGYATELGLRARLWWARQ
jgi:hypothetical protein